MIDGRRLLRSLASAVLVVLLGSVVGCGDANLGRVRGTVTLDGQPLDGAMVTFAPVEGGRPAAGRTDAQGRYQLVYSRDSSGAMIGEHLVTISTYDERPGENGEDLIIPERVPARYNANSELKKTVESGSNEINFELESEGAIVTPIE
jgi:hypothetical protein